jgi:hypothetical protein
MTCTAAIGLVRHAGPHGDLPNTRQAPSRFSPGPARFGLCTAARLVNLWLPTDPGGQRRSARRTRATNRAFSRWSSALAYTFELLRDRSERARWSRVAAADAAAVSWRLHSVGADGGAFACAPRSLTCLLLAECRRFNWLSRGRFTLRSTRHSWPEKAEVAVCSRHAASGRRSDGRICRGTRRPSLLKARAFPSDLARLLRSVFVAARCLWCGGNEAYAGLARCAYRSKTRKPAVKMSDCVSAAPLCVGRRKMARSSIHATGTVPPGTAAAGRDVSAIFVT